MTRDNANAEFIKACRYAEHEGRDNCAWLLRNITCIATVPRYKLGIFVAHSKAGSLYYVPNMVGLKGAKLDTH